VAARKAATRGGGEGVAVDRVLRDVHVPHQHQLLLVRSGVGGAVLQQPLVGFLGQKRKSGRVTLRCLGFHIFHP
jgi:hypothetical protein